MPSRGKPAANPPRVIIFDIGQVILRVNLSLAVKGLGTGLSPGQIFQALEADSRWADWQTGRMTSRDFHLHLSEKFGFSLGFDRFCEAWNRVLDPVPILEESLFERLSCKCRLALLSNTDPLHVTHIEAAYPFVRHFPVRIYSCRVGARKPSPAIYHHALGQLGAAPEEALYIDDVKPFVAAAVHIGMRGVCFISPDELRGEFSRLGLLAS
jgi:glucose-1-phosphatase